MSKQDKIDKDGIRDDYVPYDPAASRLHIYQDDRQQLANFQTPILLHANNPHERLFVAALDGTGNDKIHDPDHETNVGRISDQIEILNDAGNTKIVSGYVPGPGTQADMISRVLDGATGNTADARTEQMYKNLIDQAKTWRHDDPNVQIRIAGVGFSRGSDEVALFARLVEERGIQDRDGAKYTYDSHHQITHVEYTKPPLVPPHQVAQAVVLFDPVGTGHEMHEDRRLPPSVISGIQFTAMDEHRSLFKSDRIIDPGITPDGRFAGVYVPGAHSDVGGSYHRDGLSIRTGNLAIDYFNRLSDQPILAKQAEPDDPRLNVIHHSQDGMLLYRLAPKIDRLQPGGYNTLEVPKSQIGHVADPYHAEPRNDALSRQFEWQRVYPELAPLAPTMAANNAHTPVSERVLTPEPPSLVAARAIAARNGSDVTVTLKNIERPDAPGQLKHPLPPSLAATHAPIAPPRAQGALYAPRTNGPRGHAPQATAATASPDAHAPIPPSADTASAQAAHAARIAQQQAAMAMETQRAEQARDSAARERAATQQRAQDTPRHDAQRTAEHARGAERERAAHDARHEATAREDATRTDEAHHTSTPAPASHAPTHEPATEAVVRDMAQSPLYKNADGGVTEKALADAAAARLATDAQREATHATASHDVQAPPPSADTARVAAEAFHFEP